MLNLSCDPTLVNCIFWDKQAIYPGDNANIDGLDSTPTVTNCNIERSAVFPGVGNLNADPLFVDAANGDFRLLPGSPCFNTGSNEAAVAVGLTTDLDGNPRIVRGTVDIGAYERQNKAPDAEDDGADTQRNRAVTLSVLNNDDDPDGDALTVVAVSAPANGTATLGANGTVTYTPRRGYVGPDTFTYTVSDGQGGTDTAAVTVDVEPRNKRPKAQNDYANASLNTPVTVSVLANDSDPNSDPLTVTQITRSPRRGVAVINANGTVTYTPNPNFKGRDRFRYEISDGKGGVSRAWVRVTVQ